MSRPSAIASIHIAYVSSLEIKVGGLPACVLRAGAVAAAVHPYIL